MTSDTQAGAGSAVLEEPEQAEGFSAGGESTAGNFPTDTLAPKVRQFVEECAASLSVPPDLVALPILVTTGAAIGSTRIIRLKKDWEEPASIYGAIVADTGSMKSPALVAATRPLTAAQSATRRTWTSDTTVEQLGTLLSENPRGLMVIRDELTGWVKSLNQYRQGGRGADREFYLSAWSSTPIAVDRRTLQEPVIIDRPFLAVAGCLPPDLLPELADRSRREDGFIERILFAWPQPIPVLWSSKEVSAGAQEAYTQLITDLMGLDWQGQAPVILPLTPTAQALFQRWHDEHCAEMYRPNLPALLRGFYAKLKGYCARLALIHTLATNPGAMEIEKESIAAAAAQVDYFKAQADKVARRLCRSVGVGNVDLVEKCQQDIKNKLAGGMLCTKRDLQRNSQFKADVFNTAWESMLKPELRQIEGKFCLAKAISLYRQTDTDVSSKVAVSTDIPTTDTTPITVAGGANHG